jgi:signal transduction histidine kinase
LDAVVQASFHRSLILRLGLVSLASFALFALLWTAYREKELAARQMDFVAGVSHELRTPLAVICSAGENLADGVALKQGKVEQYGSLVRDEGRRLSEMVEQILAFSKTEGNHETEPVPLSKLVQRAMTACTHEIRAAGAEVDVYIPEELPPVIVDPTPMAYAIRNLLSNAIRHGKSPIYMTAHPAQRGVDFSVEDQGEGIDPREAKKLFEPFYRGQTARATQVRGLGLGLSLVKRIVESQGGRVRAENRSEGGARFILTLPT